jgi:BirA family biotin operon repressor/biotin-[acetyl-CoA-carboxylase] ligase
MTAPPEFPEAPPPDLAEALDAARLRMRPLGTPVLYFASTGSTNDVASALIASGGTEGAVVIAEQQTAGRGRRGRTWFSPPGSGLYVSVVLAPARARVAPERATALLTLAAGVALSRGVERATGLAPDIKWPNDLLVGPRKLAGILAEGVASATSPGVQAVVLGYGLNISPAAYPPELSARVTSLEAELGRAVDRATICVETLVSLCEVYRVLLDGGFDDILDAWRARAPGSRGARVEWDTPAGVRVGITDGIDDGGALIVRTAEGLERIVAGEVRWGLHAARD